MKYIILIFILCLAGCTNLAKMAPPSGDLFFELESDVVNFYDYGLVKTRWVKGLSRGVYRAIGEDKNGFYFMPVTGSIIWANGEFAVEYERSGIIPKEIHNPEWGGIWIPKQATKDKLKLFQIIRKVDREYHQWEGGAIHAGLASLIDGSIVFVGMKKFPTFEGKIEIKQGYEESTGK